MVERKFREAIIVGNSSVVDDSFMSMLLEIIEYIQGGREDLLD